MDRLVRAALLASIALLPAAAAAAGEEAAADLEPPSTGLGDPVLGVRYSLFERPARWNLILEAAGKFPWRNGQQFHTSGRADGGLQISLQSECHGWFYCLALTENLANFENTPDIGVTLSVAKVVFGD